MSKFRKKPVVIDAVQFIGGKESAYATLAFIADAGAACWHTNHDTLAIPTLEGVMTASPGDWVIRGVKGECYPCKDEIFRMTYEPVL